MCYVCVSQCYISMARYVLKRPSYKQWDCYRWKDFRERATLATTFQRRHLFLSTGEENPTWDGLMTDPEEWNKKNSDPKKKVRRCVYPTTESIIAQPTTNDYAGKHWDSEEERWM